MVNKQMIDFFCYFALNHCILSQKPFQMSEQNFGHLDTETLKKRRRNYNLITIMGLLVVIGGLALHTIDEEKYRMALYGSIAFYILLAGSFRTWAIQMRKELKRRGE
jgi:hypothetical protein